MHLFFLFYTITIFHILFSDGDFSKEIITFFPAKKQHNTFSNETIMTRIPFLSSRTRRLAAATVGG